MEPSRLFSLGSFAAGGVSTIAGTAITGASLPKAATLVHGGTHEDPFSTFDLECVKETKKNIFSGLENPEQIRAQISTDVPAVTQFTLPSPATPLTGTTQACLRTTFHQTEESNNKKIYGVTLELAASRGNHGIILMHALTNIKKFGARLSDYRAIFLEKKGTKWEINGGVGWSDATFLNQIMASPKLKWTGLPLGEKEIVWHGDAPTLKQEAHTLYWKDDKTKNKNTYQELIVKGETVTDSQTQDFWNGKQEPLEANSYVTKATHLFGQGLWRRPQGQPVKNLTEIKAWFNLFKEEKGTWEKSSS